MRGWGLSAGVLTALLTALLLAGCGGSDRGGSTSGQSGAAPAPEGKQQTKPTGAGQGTSGTGSGDRGRKPESHFEGGEEEVEEFGSEAQGSAKHEVLATERNYLSAIATTSYEQACTRLASAVTGSLQKKQAFVIFHAPGARLWTLPLSNEGGGWKVATLAPTVLAPSAATLGE